MYARWLSFLILFSTLLQAETRPIDSLKGFQNIDEMGAAVHSKVGHDFTVARDSHSRHKPVRVIGFSEAGLLTSASPSQPFMEVGEFYQRRLHLYDFRQTEKGFTPTPANPRACHRCHSNPPLVIWTAYPNWPAFHGGEDDVMTTHEEYNTHRSMLSAEPRFKGLFPDDASGIFPYTNKRFDPNYENRPNLRLGKLVLSMATSEKADRIRQATKYSQFVYPLLMILERCDLDSIREILKGRIGEHTGTLVFDGIYIDLMKILGVDPMVVLDRPAFEIPAESWDQAAMDSLGIFDGNQYVRDLLFSALVTDIDDKVLKEKYLALDDDSDRYETKERKKLAHELFRFWESKQLYPREPNEVGLCGYLEKRARENLNVKSSRAESTVPHRTSEASASH